MTVLQVCAYAAPYEGNFIKSLKALGEELAAKGHRMIYAFPENARDIEWCQALAEQTDVYFLPLAQARLRPKTYLELRKIYGKHPDLRIIHTHFELYDVPVSMTRPRGVRVFWHLHDALEGYTGLKHRLVHRAQYALLHRDAVLLSVSEKHRDYVLRLGFPAKQANYVPNGLNVDRIRQVSEATEKTYDFLLFGWEFERKGVDLCVEAVKRLEKKPRVAVVGNANTAQRIGQVPGMEVVQPVADINELYGQCRCFLHISRAEGLSYALLEAVYAGLPVICSDIPENRFAQRFPTVTMVKSEDPVAIADAMDAMQLPAQAAVADSRRQIEAEYSIACWVNHMLEHYGL